MRNPFSPLFERRDAIGSSQALWDYLSRGATSISGQAVTEATALNVAAVWTCVSLRSRALASLPLKVYERVDDRTKRPAPNHPVARVLSQPNTWQTKSEFVGMLAAHHALRGNAYAWKNLTTVVSASTGELREQVQQLIPLHPDRIEVEQPGDLGGDLIYKLRRKNGQVLVLPQKEVLHIRGLSTDGLVGRSVLQDAREVIGSALALQEHSSLFWQKGGTPAVVLKHPKTLTPKAKDSLEKSWEKLYGGSKEQRRVAVIEEGMELHQLSLTQNDSQFLQTSQDLREQIYGWFHVPPVLAGYTQKSTSWGTGVEQQQLGFLVFTMNPDIVAWEDRLTRDLIQVPDKYFIKFSVNGFMRGDQNARSTFYDRMVRMGAYTLNDVLAFEDMNPFDGGDEHIVDMNRQPVGAEPPPAPDAGAGATN